MSETHIHASHPDIVKRLKRAEGHLRSIVTMIESERSCVDIAQQMHAVEKAVAQAKKALIQDHMDHCLAPGASSPDTLKETLEEFRVLAKYL